MKNHDTAILLLRIGIAFTFVYAVVSAFLNPLAWIGFFPVFLQDMVSQNVLLYGWGIVELVIAGLLLFQKRPFYASLVAAVMMAGIVVLNLGALDIVFRDVGLFFASVALALFSRKEITSNIQTNEHE